MLRTSRTCRLLFSHLIRQNLWLHSNALHILYIRRVNKILFSIRCSQTGFSCVKCMAGAQSLLTSVKHENIYRHHNTDSSESNKELDKVSTKSTETNVTHSDKTQRIFQKEKSSLPDHDVSRITPLSRKLEVKADNIFDELAALRGPSKATFLLAVDSYISRETLYRRGAVEFIYAGLQRMQFFGVSRDMVAYKALLQALPEDKMIPGNIWQVEFMHYPRQQQCIIDMLEQMETIGLIPDEEFGKLLKNRFGIAAHVTRKYQRMIYWLPKLKNLNPYPVQFDLPTDPVELALIALKRMCVDLNTQYHVYKTSEMDVNPEEDTFIASAQSPDQQQLIAKHNSEQPLFVEGPYVVYLRTAGQKYFLLRADPDVNSLLKEKQRLKDEEDDDKLFEWTNFFEDEQSQEIRRILSVHEQEDSTILGLCITGTCTKSSIVTWIRCLEKSNPNLAKTPILFKLSTPHAEIEAVGNSTQYREFQK